MPPDIKICAQALSPPLMQHFALLQTCAPLQPFHCSCGVSPYGDQSYHAPRRHLCSIAPCSLSNLMLFCASTCYACPLTPRAQAHRPHRHPRATTLPPQRHLAAGTPDPPTPPPPTRSPTPHQNQSPTLPPNLRAPEPPTAGRATPRTPLSGLAAPSAAARCGATCQIAGAQRGARRHAPRRGARGRGRYRGSRTAAWRWAAPTCSHARGYDGLSPMWCLPACCSVPQRKYR